MFKQPEPDGVLSAADVKEAAADVIHQLPMGGLKSSPLDSDDIWPVVTMASVNQTSAWEVTSQTDETPYDDMFSIGYIRFSVVSLRWLPTSSFATSR